MEAYEGSSDCNARFISPAWQMYKIAAHDVTNLILTIRIFQFYSTWASIAVVEIPRNSEIVLLTDIYFSKYLTKSHSMQKQISIAADLDSCCLRDLISQLTAAMRANKIQTPHWSNASDLKCYKSVYKLQLSLTYRELLKYNIS